MEGFTVLDDRIRRLERRMLVFQSAFMFAVPGFIAYACGALPRTQAQLPASMDTLRLRTLTIVDENGVERVRLGGQLPDAVVNGMQVPRGEQAAGVLIYDDAGTERGGYVTFSPSRNAALTLDTRKAMVVLLAADSSDGAALRLWRANFSDWLDLRAGPAGARLTAGRQNEVVLQQPPMSAAEAATFCAEFRGELSQLAARPPVQEILRACKQHMPESACRGCLGPDWQ
jgi:hypothetical protein